METHKITINDSYAVLLKNGILGDLGDLVSESLGISRAFIITDADVAPLYLAKAEAALRGAGYDVKSAVLPAGEACKTAKCYISVLNDLANAGFSKSDIVIALGGGAVSDLAGFAAATYMRGIRYAVVPTTLLSMVDSSIGGKTAIDLAAGKNLAGAFHDPALVVMDPLTLKTLHASALQNGYAEIIKYGILSGDAILDSLRHALFYDDFENVIFSSLSLKKHIVEKDAHDSSIRQYLNFGHLIGHAFEAHEGFGCIHGKAVALGLALETKGCAMAGLTEYKLYEEISDLISEFGFRTTTKLSASDLMPFVLRDKRIRNGRIDLVIPEAIGRCRMKNIDLDELGEFIKLALE